MLVGALFTLGQVILYLYVFTPKLWQRLVGFFVPLAVILTLTLTMSQVDLDSTVFLPEDPVLTEAAVAESDNNDLAEITVTNTGKDSIIRIKAHQYGTTEFIIKDSDKVYRYKLEIYEDDGGHPQTSITPIS